MRKFALIVAAGLCVAAVARGQETWTLTTADFAQRAVSVRSFDDKTLAVDTPNGSKEISADQVLRLERSGEALPPVGLVLLTRGGDRYVGVPKGLEGETVVWTCGPIGEVKLPLAAIAGVRRVTDAKTPVALATDETEDVVRLTNGDTVRGILNSIDAKQVAIQPAGGAEATIAIESVASITLANTAAPATAGGRAFRVNLTDGSAVSCSAVSLEEGKLALTPVAGPATTVNVSQVVALEQINGPVAWLSDRTPVSSVQTPFLDTAPQPARMNRTVTGEPIRLNGRTYAHGIGVHSRSVLVFAVEPGDKTFRTRVAIDGAAPYADVTVRVKVDDRTVFEKPSLRNGDPSDVITADLAGAKTLTLEIDYGKGYDVQDRVNWIEPAVLREGPATRP